MNLVIFVTLQRVALVGLNRKDAFHKERKQTNGGSFYYIYYFKCTACGCTISSQHNYLKKHSGLCCVCSHRGKPYIAAYNQLVNNKHKCKIPVTLSYEEFYELCLIPNCHYCDKPINRTLKRGNKGYRGYFIDRKDNNLGYTNDNCVPCCWFCNQTKSNRFTYEQFMKLANVIKTF